VGSDVKKWKFSFFPKRPEKRSEILTTPVEDVKRWKFPLFDIRPHDPGSLTSRPAKDPKTKRQPSSATVHQQSSNTPAVQQHSNNTSAGTMVRLTRPTKREMAKKREATKTKVEAKEALLREMVQYESDGFRRLLQPGHTSARLSSFVRHACRVELERFINLVAVRGTSLRIQGTVFRGTYAWLAELIALCAHRINSVKWPEGLGLDLSPLHKLILFAYLEKAPAPLKANMVSLAQRVKESSSIYGYKFAQALSVFYHEDSVEMFKGVSDTSLYLMVRSFIQADIVDLMYIPDLFSHLLRARRNGRFFYCLQGMVPHHQQREFRAALVANNIEA
jgi:hypothetical protein